jgi:methionine-S-sulfoxide reductase
MAAMGNSNSDAAACAANFAPTLDAAAGETITLGAGCYWGTEKFYRKDFQKLFPASVTFTAVGFMGPEGSIANPSYEAVCSGATGHVEVLHFKIDPTKASFEDAVRFFFTFHDPTTPNRQVRFCVFRPLICLMS